jgi:hypothetical protein
MTEKELQKQLELVTKERDSLTVKLYQTRVQLKCFRRKAKSAKYWSECMRAAVNQSGQAKFIENLTRKIYLGTEVKKVGCHKCNPVGIFNYGGDEDCVHCAGTGHRYIGVTE